jgi:hypothetical protein
LNTDLTLNPEKEDNMANTRLLGRMSFTIAGLLGLMGLLLSSCGPTVKEYRRDINYEPFSAVNLKVPTGDIKKAETPYMVAFVHPSYEASTLQVTESLKHQIEMLKRYTGRGAALPGIYRKMDNAEIEYLDRIKEVLQADLDQILLAKNIRVLGSFTRRDEMTFDEKKRAIYAFTPEIRLDVKTSYTVTSQAKPYVEKGEIIVSGEVIFALRESITGEKLWIKRIDAPQVKKPYEFIAKYKDPIVYEQVIQVVGIPIPTSLSSDEKDSTDHVLASALSEFYAGLGDKLWRHIDPEEWSKYLTQAENLRREKRY